MKISLLYRLFLLFKIPRYTVTWKICLFILLNSIVLSAKANWQQVLDSKISLSLKNVPIDKALTEIEKLAQVKFSFNSKTLKNVENINIDADNEKLAGVLSELLLPLNIQYVQINNQIVLQKLSKRKALTEAAKIVEESKDSQINNIKVKGTVKDSKGEKLIGVSVIIKGTASGTLTNVNGEYSIDVPNENSVLVFSYLGFNLQEQIVGKRTAIDVVLTQDSKLLNEIVVVGYGQVNRRDLTGSVGKVDVADMQKAPVASFEEALGGRVAGVQVTSQSGQPGDGFQISIRGNNSVTQSNGPLYVIDGFPIEGFNNSLINPAEIESMDILKDASATAIYGARGANGVVIITTKRGKEGPPQINYQGYIGGLEVSKKLDLLEPYEFVKLQLQINPTQATTQYLTRSGRTLEDYRNIESNNIQDKVFRQALMKSHYLSIRGGSIATKYSLSANLFGQDGVIKNSGYDRFQINASLDQNISSKFKVGLSLSYTKAAAFGTITAANSQNQSDRGSGNTSPTGYLMYTIFGYRPTTGNTEDYLDELIDPDLPISNLNYVVNPYIQVTNELQERLDENNIINTYAEWNPFKYIKLRSTFGINNLRNTRNNFNNSNTSSGNPLTSPNSILVNGTVLNTNTYNWSNENTITFNRTYNKVHNVTLLAGATAQGGSVNTGGFRAIQVPNESLGISGLDEGTVSSINSTSTNWTLASFLTRANYSYKSKYLFTANFRADGSSRFSDNNKWAYFPSGSFAWRFTEEKFAKSVIPFLNDGKLRFGYGQTGNNRVNDFSYLSTIITSGINNTYSFNNAAPGTSAVVSSLGNQNLKWETTLQSNLGLDLGLLNRRLQITVDAYNKLTKDLLILAPVTRNSGYFNILQNVGKVRNYGLEFSFTYKVLDQTDLKWNTNFNISFNRNKVLALAENQEAITFSMGDRIGGNNPVSISKVGYPIGAFYGYLWDGVYQLNDFDRLIDGKYRLKPNIPTNGNTAVNIQPGDIKYKDLNGDYTLSSNDNTIIGNPNPKHYGGFSNNLSYKGFDLNIFFQWSYGNDIANVNRMIFEGGGEFPNNLNQFKSVENRWSFENQSSNIPRFRPGSNLFSNVFSSRTIEDGSYLRLKTVSLAYNIPAKLLKKAKFKSTQIYASAQNLMTWTNYSGYDPEVSVSNNSLAPGIDFSAYPRNRTLTLGVNLLF